MRTGPMRAFLLVTFLPIGCAANVHYTPMRSKVDAPPAKFVQLEVVNARPPRQGGDDTRAVGIARGGYGNPMTFRQNDPGDLLRLVREASEDALKHSGVGARPGTGSRLIARILRFWMDGYVGYGADVEVEYVLTDATGKPAWSAHANGKAGGAVFSFGAASDLLSTALAEMASEATAQFRSAPFQNAAR